MIKTKFRGVVRGRERESYREDTVTGTFYFLI